MPKPAIHSNPITTEAVADYLRDGYLVVPDLISTADLASLKDDALAFARGKYRTPLITAVAEGASDAQALDGILCIHQPHHVSPLARRMVAHPGIAAVLGRIVAAHLPGWDGSVGCMQSMFFVKPPGKPGQAWHQDEFYIPTRDRSLTGAWIAVDDADVDNGCLWVLPGSQRSGRIFPTRPHGSMEFDPSAEAFGFDDSAAVPVAVKAGTVIFFNGYLLHRSLRNRSTRSRRALVNHYWNTWSPLPWGAPLPDNRAIVPVCGADPYADKGYEDVSDGRHVHLRRMSLEEQS